MAIGEKVDFLFREINGCLDIDAQTDQLLGEVMHTQRKRPLQRAQRIACGLCRTGLDQVGNRLGLGQIEFVIEKRALAELTRPGQATTQLQAALQQHIQDDRTAMALQFQHIFTGE